MDKSKTTSGLRIAFRVGRLWLILALVMSLMPVPASVFAQDDPPPAPSEYTMESVGETTSEPMSEPTPEPPPDIPPTIESDRLDYLPGELVTLTGANWQGDDQVHIIVNDDVGSSWQRDVMVPVAEDGTIVDSFNLPTWFVAIYSVLASGQQTGRVATTSFTDAPPKIEQLWQCDPPTGYNPSTFTCETSGPTGWVTGNNDGPFKEGETIPYRTRFQNLVTGNAYSITIEWDTTKGSKHALDYLKTWNATITAANPCLSLTGLPAGLCSGPPSTWAIAADTFMQADTAWIDNAGVQDPGNFSMHGGTISGLSGYTTPLDYTGDTSTSITLYFTANSTDAVLAWGGHIAERDDWGPDNSAVAIPGSPYHMRILTFYDVTNNASLNVGNTDRSLSAEAVIYPGSITIIKDATPNGSTSFPFTASPSPLTNFSLVDDGTSANTKVFSEIINFTTYTVNESPIPPGWAFDSVSCSVTSANGGSYSTSATTVNITLKEGENWTCTYYDSLKQGTLEVRKYEDLNGSGDYQPTEPWLSGWDIFVDENRNGAWDSPEPKQTTDGDGKVSFTLDQGTYWVCEILDNGSGGTHEGWVNSDPGDGSVADPGVCKEVTVTADQTTTEKFGNFELGTKAGKKFEDVDGDGAYDAEIDELREGWVIVLLQENGDAEGLQLPGETDPDDVVASTATDANGEYSFGNLTAGDYYVVERCPEGWVQTYPNTDNDLDTCDYYAFTVDSGFEELTNDFGNFQLGTKAGIKFWDRNQDGERGEPEIEIGIVGWTVYVDYDGDGSFDEGDTPDCQGDGTDAAEEPCAVTGEDGAYLITGIKPGTYKIREVLQDGWTCTHPDADTGTEEVECWHEETFTSGSEFTGNDFGNWRLLSQLTDTEFCPLPNDQFRLIYIQDPIGDDGKTDWSRYRLNSSNPGQWYYNVFYPGTPGDEVLLRIQIPYPFVTQGAVPIQVHDGYDLDGDCYVPYPSLPGYDITTDGGNLSPSGNPIILLEDYGTSPVIGETQTNAYVETTVAAKIPQSGLLYITIHLDYGLKKTSDWYKDGLPDETTGLYDAFNATYGTILSTQPYTFGFTDGLSDAQTYESINAFKKNPGVGGAVVELGSDDPIAGLTVQLLHPNGTLIGDWETDEDGVYMIYYKHKGRPTEFTVSVVGYEGASQQVTLKGNGFAIANFELE